MQSTVDLNDIEFKLGNISEHLDTLTPMLEEHRKELAVYPEIMTLNPDKSRYKHLEDLNCIFTILAVKDEEVVGYSVNIISYSLHYSHLKYCENDVVYLSKEYRRSGLGKAMIKLTEEIASELGCDLMTWGSKKETALMHLLDSMDYQVQEITYSKEL